MIFRPLKRFLIINKATILSCSVFFFLSIIFILYLILIVTKNSREFLLFNDNPGFDGSEWCACFGSYGYDSGQSLLIDGNNNIYLGGRISGITDFNPGMGMNLAGSNRDSRYFLSKFDNKGSNNTNMVWGIDHDEIECINYQMNLFKGADDQNYIAGRGMYLRYFIENTKNIYVIDNLIPGYLGSIDLEGNLYMVDNISSLFKYNNRYDEILEIDPNYTNTDICGGAIYLDGFGITHYAYENVINIYSNGEYYISSELPGVAMAMDMGPNDDIALCGLIREQYLTDKVSYINYYKDNYNLIWNININALINSIVIRGDSIYVCGYIYKSVNINSGNNSFRFEPVYDGTVPLDTAIVMQFDLNGNLLWGVSADVFSRAENVDVDSGGNIYVTGSMKGDVFVAKISNNIIQGQQPN
jgi:hypothetical protein